MNTVEVDLLKKRAKLYLAIVYGFVGMGWILAITLPKPYNKTAYTLLIATFSLFPLLANFFTRKITKDSSPWMIKPHLKKNWKTYLFAAFIPSILIVCGAVLYFFMFPNHLDLSMQQLTEVCLRFGIPNNLPPTLSSIIKIAIEGILISPFIIPVEVAALGEGIGWRGYLLPIFLKLMNTQKAVLLNGILWGVCHASLIYFGFNYGLDYWGAPYIGILLMILVCVVLGIWLSYVTIKTESVIPACVLHGAVNVIGEWPILVAVLGVNTLIGPNPTGVIGMSGLIVGAIIILSSLNSKREKHKRRVYK